MPDLRTGAMKKIIPPELVPSRCRTCFVQIAWPAGLERHRGDPELAVPLREILDRLLLGHRF